MMSLFQRAIATIRTWLGMNDPEENHLHASHGWLLPDVSTVRARNEQAGPAPDGSIGWPKL